MTIRTRKIGKLGGAAEPLDLTPAETTSNITVDLPDGQWTLVVEVISNGAQNTDLLIDGTVVLSGSINTSSHFGTHGVARHKSGSVRINTNYTRWRLGTITAYPEPT